MTTCDFCGLEVPDGPGSQTVLMTWTISVENRRKRTYCDACSRQHVRSMEGKLDSEYW